MQNAVIIIHTTQMIFFRQRKNVLSSIDVNEMMEIYGNP